VQVASVKSNPEINHISRPEINGPHKPTAGSAVRKALKIASVDFYVPLENQGQALANPAAALEVKTVSVGSSAEGALASDNGELRAVFSAVPTRRVTWAPVLLIVGFLIIVVSIALAVWH
jgi:hypothetical protein